MSVMYWWIKHGLNISSKFILIMLGQMPVINNISHKVVFIKKNFFSFIFISWRLISLQYCSGFCHTLTWIRHGFTRVPHPDTPSHFPPHPIPLGLPSAPALNVVFKESIQLFLWFLIKSDCYLQVTWKVFFRIKYISENKYFIFYLFLIFIEV